VGPRLKEASSQDLLDIIVGFAKLRWAVGQDGAFSLKKSTFGYVIGLKTRDLPARLSSRCCLLVNDQS